MGVRELHNIKSSFDIVFFSGIEKEVIKMTNIKGLQFFGSNWNVLGGNSL